MIGAADPCSGTWRGGDGNPKGVVRPALTASDLEARHWLMDQSAEAGLVPEMDAIGTTISRAGPSAPPGPRLLVGSHSDTQAQGGWLDGALGVVYALEACRAVAEAGGPAVLDLVNFQDEEGRFGSLVGSTIFCGGDASQLWDALSLVPESAAPAITLAEAAALHPELAGKELLRLPPKHNYRAFLEAHIEQGRRLERAQQSAGVVTSIVGLRQMNIQFFGEQNHAGEKTRV